MKERPEKRNYYEILHVSRDAPAEIIRGSYRTLMQKLGHHPDLGGDTATAAMINEAYAVLSDTERRAEYDARLDLCSLATEFGVHWTNRRYFAEWLAHDQRAGTRQRAAH